MSSAALSSQGTIPTPEQVCAAAKAVGYALGDQDYALVGGAANGKVQGEGRCQVCLQRFFQTLSSLIQ